MSLVRQTQAVYLGDRTALVKTVYDAKLYVDTADGDVAPHLLVGGVWEAWLTQYAGQHLGPGMTVVDIGANCGWYTLFAALRVAPTGRVYAFEPNPRFAGLLRRSVAINGLGRIVRVEQAAVSDAGGDVELAVPVDRPSGASIVGLVPSSLEVERHVVLGVSLDEYFCVDGGRVDFMKIDAEGAEPAILRGAREVLERSPRAKLMVEHHAGDGAAFEMLWGLGYSTFTVDALGLTTRVSSERQLAALGDAEMLFCSR